MDDRAADGDIVVRNEQRELLRRFHASKLQSCTTIRHFDDRAIGGCAIRRQEPGGFPRGSSTELSLLHHDGTPAPARTIVEFCCMAQPWPRHGTNRQSSHARGTSRTSTWTLGDARRFLHARMKAQLVPAQSLAKAGGLTLLSCHRKPVTAGVSRGLVPAMAELSTAPRPNSTRRAINHWLTMFGRQIARLDQEPEKATPRASQQGCPYRGKMQPARNIKDSQLAVSDVLDLGLAYKIQTFDGSLLDEWSHQPPIGELRNLLCKSGNLHWLQG